MTLYANGAAAVIKNGILGENVTFDSSGSPSIRTLTNVSAPVADTDLANFGYVSALKGPTGAPGAQGAAATTSMTAGYTTEALTWLSTSGMLSSPSNGRYATLNKGNGNKWILCFTANFAAGSGSVSAMTRTSRSFFGNAPYMTYAAPTDNGAGQLIFAMVAVSSTGIGGVISTTWQGTSNCTVAGSYNVVMLQE